MTPLPIVRWLNFIERGHAEILDDLLAENVAFYSPAVFTPQLGHVAVARYLLAAEQMFHGTDFHYVGQWFADRSAVLEFAAELDGIHVEGVDIIYWDERDQITSFKVMVRPYKATQTVIATMGALLAAAEGN